MAVQMEGVVYLVKESWEMSEHFEKWNACRGRHSAFWKARSTFFYTVIPIWYLLGIMIKKVRNESHLHHATPLCGGHSPNNGPSANYPPHNLPPQTLVFIFLVDTVVGFLVLQSNKAVPVSPTLLTTNSTNSLDFVGSEVVCSKRHKREL